MVCNIECGPPYIPSRRYEDLNENIIERSLSIEDKNGGDKLQWPHDNLIWFFLAAAIGVFYLKFKKKI